jgi:hypothetical protein
MGKARTLFHIICNETMNEIDEWLEIIYFYSYLHDLKIEKDRKKKKKKKKKNAYYVTIVKFQAFTVLQFFLYPFIFSIKLLWFLLFQYNKFTSKRKTNIFEFVLESIMIKARFFLDNFFL